MLSFIDWVVGLWRCLVLHFEQGSWAFCVGFGCAFPSWSGGGQAPGHIAQNGAVAINHEYPYVTRLDVEFGPLQVVDEKIISDSCPHKWFNQTVCAVNDSVVRLGVVQGEYHWHKHDKDDEFFYVLEGMLSVDLEDRTIELGPRQGLVVPKGLVHRTRASERTVMLMVETRKIVPTGD